jgi:hypothetical protein
MNEMLRHCVSLLGAPAFWIVQMSLSEPLAANACYPHQLPLSTPRWEGLVGLLTIISLLCLIAGLASGVVACHSWLKVQDEKPGNGRNRFLAHLGLFSSFIFIIALLLTTCGNLLVLPCHP